MGEQWLTVQEAAKALGCAERTVWNRIKRDEYQVRVREDGRREVLIETPPERAEGVQEAFHTYHEGESRQIQIASTAVGLAEKHAEVYRRDLKAARWSARLAWCAVAIAAGVIGWGVHIVGTLEGHVATARVRASDLGDSLRQTRQTAAQAQEQAVEARRRAQDAADGLLAAERRTSGALLAQERLKAEKAALAVRLADLIQNGKVAELRQISESGKASESAKPTTQPALAAK